MPSSLDLSTEDDDPLSPTPLKEQPSLEYVASVVASVAANITHPEAEVGSDHEIEQDPPPAKRGPGRPRKKGGAQSKPATQRNPRLKAAYIAHERALRENKPALREVEESAKALAEAKRRHELALERRKAMEEAVKSTADEVVEAELQDEDEWNDMYRKLREYKAAGKDILFSLGKDYHQDAELQELNQWVIKQRKFNKRLKWFRKAALDKIGFVWHAYDATWAEKYRELLAFKAEKGHCMVPARYEPNPQLATWVLTQRRHYRLMIEGKKSQLTNERVKMLEDAGFAWQCKTWMDRYNEVVAFKNQTGDFVIPKDHPNQSLRPWAQTQRTHYRFYMEGKPSLMTPERIKMLEDAGFPWKLHEGAWQKRFEELVSYKAEHGSCIVPDKHEKYPSLSRWVRRQRSEYKLMAQGKPSYLKPEQMKLLDDIGFVWNLPKY